MKRSVWIIACLLIITGSAFAQNEAHRPAMQDAPNVFTGSTHDFFFAGAIATPAPPLVSPGATTGGACLSTAIYRVYASQKNSSGETNLSPASAEIQPSSGTTNIIAVTVTDAMIGDNVSTWSAWYSTSTDSHATIRGCSTDGARVDTAAATLIISCVCGTATDPVEPAKNTTHDVYVLRVYNTPTTTAVSAPTFTGPAALVGNSLTVDEETALVFTNAVDVINAPVGFNNIQARSVEVRSGCALYDFTLNSSDTFGAGTELLRYIGQTYILRDALPPMLHDDDLTGEVHARFWNRGDYPCTFELVLTGGGY